MQQNNNIQEDTIDLRELFAILKRRKRMIWSVTIVLTTLAIVYAFFIAKPVYEIKSMIEIGQIDDKPIDDIEDIQQKLAYEYKVNSKGIKKELPLVKSVSASKNSKSILSLTIHANNNSEGIKYIQTVIHNIEAQYQKKTDAYITNQKELIKTIQNEITQNNNTLKKMQQEITEYSNKIITLKHEDAALAGIYAMQIGQQQTPLLDLKKFISELNAKAQELQLSLTPLKIKSTHIVGEIETLENPVKPKKILITIVAFITGLMLSVFLAFFLEFIAGMKKEED